MNDQLLPGCLVFRKDVHVGLVDHYGVVLTQNPFQIAHIDKSASGKLRVKREPFEVFAAGSEVRFLPIAIAVTLDVMEARIAEVAAKGPPFGLLAIGQDWNCECFARYIATGTPVSKQANTAKGLAALALIGVGMVALAANADQEEARRAALRRALRSKSPPLTPPRITREVSATRATPAAKRTATRTTTTTRRAPAAAEAPVPAQTRKPTARKTTTRKATARKTTTRSR